MYVAFPCLVRPSIFTSRAAARSSKAFRWFLTWGDVFLGKIRWFLTWGDDFLFFLSREAAGQHLGFFLLGGRRRLVSMKVIS